MWTGIAHRRLGLCAAALVLLAACAQATQTPAVAGTVAVIASPSVAPIAATFPLAVTATSLPSLTPTPAATLLPTFSVIEMREARGQILSSATPTVVLPATPAFDLSHVVRRTAAPPAQCPPEKHELTVPGFDFSASTSEEIGQLLNQILDFLNSGGSRQAVIAAYRLHVRGADQSVVQEKDVTGDGVPDLLLTTPDFLVAYVCQNGQYQLFNVIAETYHFYQPAIITIRDMNLDGVDEIMAIAGDERIRMVYVLEWGGNQFQLLNGAATGAPPRPCSDLLGPSWAYAVDSNHSGLLDLVLKQAIPIWSEYEDGLPWRKETRTCTWNGSSFVLNRTEFDTPPEYRFQAVQDGDRAALAGDYNKALDSYQQAIFNDSLDWWSQDRKNYEIGVYGKSQVMKPTPIPSLSADPAEYPTLAAYARYRIMLLHVLQGHLGDAETVYRTLQADYPEGRAGHVHAELATTFWQEYQSSGNVGEACDKAVVYATSHSAEALAYLGNSQYAGYFGNQSLTYTAPDLCPFHSR